MQTHVNHLGLSGQPDWWLPDGSRKTIYLRDNNRVDFIQLFGQNESASWPHRFGPNVVPALQRFFQPHFNTGAERLDQHAHRGEL